MSRLSITTPLLALLMMLTLSVDASGAPPPCLWSQRFGVSSAQYGTSVATDAAGNVILAGTFEGRMNLGGVFLTSAGGNDVFVAKFTSGGSLIWARRYGNASNQFAQAVTTDGPGNVVVTGYFNGSIDFGGGALNDAGGNDIFVAKLDPVGSHVWSKRYGDASPQFGNAVATDGIGNVYLTGQFQGSVNFGGGVLTSAGSADVFLAKLTPAGGHAWSRAYGDADDMRGFGVASDASGVVITGAFRGSVDFGGGTLTSGGGWDIFAAKFDQVGVALWSQGFGDASDQYGNSVTIDSGGNVILAGLLSGSADFGGGSLSSAGDYDAVIAKFDADGFHLWSQRYGDASLQWASSVRTNPSGSVILTGHFNGSIDFGGDVITSGGGQDIFLAMFDVFGIHQWSLGYGDAAEQAAFALAVDGSGNLLVAGSLEGTADFGGGGRTSAGAQDVLLVKLDPIGGHLWSQRHGEESEQYGTSVATDAAGNVILAGTFQGTIDLGGGPLVSAGGNDVFVAKYSPAGSHLWSRRFGDANQQFAQSVTTNAAGDVILTGYFQGSIDFGGGALAGAGTLDIYATRLNSAGGHVWSKRFGDGSSQVGNAVATDENGNVYLTGQFSGTVNFGGGALTSAGQFDVFLAKLDPNGSHIWSRRFGDANDMRGFSVATDASNNVVITGGFRGSADFGGGALVSGGSWDIFLAKFSSGGVHAWSRRFGDAADQYGNSVATDGKENVILAGLLAGSADFGGGALTSAGDYDVAVAQFGQDGSHLWSRRFGDANLQWASCVTADLAGDVIVTGYFYGDVDFGGGSLTSAGESDIFSVLLDPTGVHQWSQRYGNAGTQTGYSVARDNSGNIILAGAFDGAADFGTGNLVSAGGTDAYLAKFGPTVSGVVDAPNRPAVAISAAPNPFNPATTIRYAVPATGQVRVEVFDVNGALVATLVDALQEAGTYSQTWRGVDDRGRPVGAGVYFARVSHPAGERLSKLVLVR